MTKIIGLTGGIGSGKSTLAKYFNSKGIPVYISDYEARKITEYPEIIEQIKKLFGAEVTDGNILNRAKLAQLVFNDAEKLEQLNGIIHPEVKKDFQNWLKRHTHHAFVIKEAAVLFESGAYKECDSIITVIAPMQTRIDRVVKRDKISVAQVMERINNQWTDEERLSKSNFVIENDEIKHALRQTDEILKKLTIR
ncbi:MAG: dephospho-CoA kinase [Burkholderiales bacterium]|nr:dephospho-CoA kinase [Flavobacterium sp.]